MTSRGTSTAVDNAVAILAARLTELRAIDRLEPDDRREAMALATLLADIEAKQEHAQSVRAGLLLAALVGKRSLDSLSPHEREKAIRVLSGEEPAALPGVEDEDE